MKFNNLKVYATDKIIRKKLPRYSQKIKYNQFASAKNINDLFQQQPRNIGVVEIRSRKRQISSQTEQQSRRFQSPPTWRQSHSRLDQNQISSRSRGQLINSSSGPIEYIGMREPELSEWQKLRQIHNPHISNRDKNSELNNSDSKSPDFSKFEESQPGLAHSG